MGDENGRDGPGGRKKKKITKCHDSRSTHGSADGSTILDGEYQPVSRVCTAIRSCLGREE